LNIQKVKFKSDVLSQTMCQRVLLVMKTTQRQQHKR